MADTPTRGWRFQAHRTTKHNHVCANRNSYGYSGQSDTQFYRVASCRADNLDNITNNKLDKCFGGGGSATDGYGNNQCRVI